MYPTRFRPNRPAADTEGNGEFDFWIFGVILEDFWRFFEEFWKNLFVEEKKIKNFHQAETLLFWWPQRPPQPLRSNLTSDLESMVQTSYATIFVWTV